MIRRPPRSTRTDTLFPYTTLCRSKGFFVPFPQKTSVGSTVHQIAIIFLQLQGQGTDFEIPGASRLHRGDFRGTPGQEELFEAFQFVRPDHAFFDFYTALAGQFDNGLACDAIERSEEHTSELQSLMRTSYAV